MDLPELTFPQLERYLQDKSTGESEKQPAASGRRTDLTINENGTVLTG